MTSLWSLLFGLIVLGLVSWFLETLPLGLIPRRAIQVVLAIIALVLIFRALGVATPWA